MAAPNGEALPLGFDTPDYQENLETRAGNSDETFGTKRNLEESGRTLVSRLLCVTGSISKLVRSIFVAAWS